MGERYKRFLDFSSSGRLSAMIAIHLSIFHLTYVYLVPTQLFHSRNTTALSTIARRQDEWRECCLQITKEQITGLDDESGNPNGRIATMFRVFAIMSTGNRRMTMVLCGSCFRLHISRVARCYWV
ncbi:hypothetical protein BDZ85DRAFT_57238 [Elsinoe ampelina]|uniref:Uncharacterized protein n=1 Tax=Elsinoe ampelina TaxID=302913 RepID=A0A6A6GMR0_9PEZI|nr:hypothetical protein BDZ85DRAFT_57238 [Elsinoe ampelina]